MDEEPDVDDVESLERATLAAVPPRAQEEIEGWLLGLDPGVIGRAHSAVPLSHARASVDALPRIERSYAAHGLRTVLRIPDVPALHALRASLASAAYAPSSRTLVQTGTVAAMHAPAAQNAAVALETRPGPGWVQVFMGEGFDPQDAASRMEILMRSTSSVFARIEHEGRVAAVGCGSFSHGWCGVHGMRTAPWARGRGFATRILAAFAQEAARRGIARAYLQVDAGNAQAQSVYRKAGFTTLWAYEYWKRG